MHCKYLKKTLDTLVWNNGVDVCAVITLCSVSIGVGIIDLATKEICVFAENICGFTLGDFYLDCDLQDKDVGQLRMDLLIFYCPIRYEKEQRAEAYGR